MVYSWCKSSVCVCGWVSFKVSVVVVCRRRRHRRRRSTFVVVRLSFVGVCRRLSFVVCRSPFVVCRRLSPSSSFVAIVAVVVVEGKTFFSLFAVKVSLLVGFWLERLVFFPLAHWLCRGSLWCGVVGAWWLAAPGICCRG